MSLGRSPFFVLVAVSTCIMTYHLATTILDRSLPARALTSSEKEDLQASTSETSENELLLSHASEGQRARKALARLKRLIESSSGSPIEDATREDQASQGIKAGVRMVTGVVARPRDRAQAAQRPKRLFHTAMTCDDSPYTQWQARVMYFWYKKYKDQPESEMGGFTRVLHSGKADSLMEEIPSFVVDPLPDDKDYVVLNRPWAFVQWLERAPIEEEYIFMAEPDHIIVRPIPNMATRDSPAGFPFFYITPREDEKYLRRWFTKDMGPISNIDNIGNSPCIIHRDQLKILAPLWMNVSVEMMSDPEVVKRFEWVLEMYAYATASAMLGYSHILRKDWMIQPPYDTQVEDKFIIHYTYGNDFDLNGKFTPGKVGPWHWDKRDYGAGPPPRNLSYPPKGSAPSVFELIRRINEATASLDWVKGGAS